MDVIMRAMGVASLSFVIECAGSMIFVSVISRNIKCNNDYLWLISGVM